MNVEVLSQWAAHLLSSRQQKTFSMAITNSAVRPEPAVVMGNLILSTDSSFGFCVCVVELPSVTQRLWKSTSAPGRERMEQSWNKKLQLFFSYREDTAISLLLFFFFLFLLLQTVPLLLCDYYRECSLGQVAVARVVAPADQWLRLQRDQRPRCCYFI